MSADRRLLGERSGSMCVSPSVVVFRRVRLHVQAARARVSLAQHHHQTIPLVLPLYSAGVVGDLLAAPRPQLTVLLQLGTEPHREGNQDEVEGEEEGLAVPIFLRDSSC